MKNLIGFGLAGSLPQQLIVNRGSLFLYGSSSSSLKRTIGYLKLDPEQSEQKFCFFWTLPGIEKY